jgi:beta-glucuronidase
MLFPQQNLYRSIHDLGGYWRFQPDPGDVGERDGWPVHALPGDAMLIAVPGAWNEQLAERGLKNYVGSAWYETRFVSPHVDAASQRLMLRVGAADHHARVWLNSTFLGSHQGGYLPFEVDLTDALGKEGSLNRLVIRVDSRLTMETIPQGIDPDAAPYNGAGYDRRHVFPPARFDFFPYGGLTRSVQLLLLPACRVTSIAVESSLSGRVDLAVRISGRTGNGIVEIHDADGNRVTGPVHLAFADGTAECAIDIPDPRLWSPARPHLYSVLICLQDASGKERDRYSETFGIREITIQGGRLLLNREPLYLAGFGKHEDFPIVGRGQFRPAYLRDFELMRWIGANSFRTSHYPYDEEILRLADQLGFLVINEAPAVSLGFCSDEFEEVTPLLENHRRVLSELVARDRNHPSVIAWSPMNEPNLWSEPDYQNEASRRYFRALYDHVRGLDPTRPIIAITMAAFSVYDIALEACDIIGINRYYGWYTEPGELARAQHLLEQEMDGLYARYGKPVIITECGVDTVEGYHASTAQMFTEEYQTEFLRVYASVADQRPFCAGFHVWHFADFLTPQHFRRVVLNRKGVFTRDRDPKSAAFFLRAHWTTLNRIADNHRPRRHDDSFLVADLRFGSNESK